MIFASCNKKFICVFNLSNSKSIIMFDVWLKRCRLLCVYRVDLCVLCNRVGGCDRMHKLCIGLPTELLRFGHIKENSV